MLTVSDCTIFSTQLCTLLLQVQWFVALFSEVFQPGLFALLRAKTQEEAEQGKDKLDSAVKVN